jgi:hypothetical protein
MYRVCDRRRFYVNLILREALRSQRWLTNTPRERGFPTMRTDPTS